MKVNIIFWSGTGNTEAMANLIKAGAESADAQVEIKSVTEATSSDADNCDILVLGCPSMGAEVLEETEFEPYMASIEGNLAGKKVALFGSYGWGDGEWMRDWTERVKSAGAELAVESLIVNETPAGDDIEKCKAFGKSLC